MIHITHSSEETESLGIEIGKKLTPGTIILYQGSLGAGKTTLTKGIALGLGISEEITSPTYTIISEYEGRLPLYHLDLYRIEDSEEFEMLGLEEILWGKGISVIEWSEKIPDYFNSTPTISIDIVIQADQSRSITIKGLDL